MTENKNIKYKLETLASFWPEDLDYPQFEVAYEIESGEESFGTVCCIDLAEQALKRITELEANQAKRDLEQQAKGVSDFYNDYFHIKFTSAILIRVKNDLQARFKELRKKAQELNR